MKYFEPLTPDVENVAAAVVDATYKIHRALGPGLIESVYGKCLIHAAEQNSDHKQRNDRARSLQLKASHLH